MEPCVQPVMDKAQELDVSGLMNALQKVCGDFGVHGEYQIHLELGIPALVKVENGKTHQLVREMKRLIKG